MIHESLQWRQVHHVTVVQTLSFGIFFFFYKNFALIVCIKIAVKNKVDSVYLDIVFSVGETFYHSFK